MNRAFSSRSGGKDSMLALRRAQAAGWRVEALLARFDERGERSRSHAILPHRIACGENGGSHTFVFDGPRGAAPVAHELVAVQEVRQSAPATGQHFVAELR